MFNIIISGWGKKIVSKTKSKLDDDVLSMLHRFTSIALYLIGLIYVLSIWGIEIGPLIASLGVAGIAVAFALQSTLGNIFGGLSLKMPIEQKITDPFGVLLPNMPL